MHFKQMCLLKDAKSCKPVDTILKRRTSVDLHIGIFLWALSFAWYFFFSIVCWMIFFSFSLDCRKFVSKSSNLPLKSQMVRPLVVISSHQDLIDLKIRLFARSEGSKNIKNTCKKQCRTSSSIIGGGGAHIHIFVFTDHKNNRFQKKLITQNTNTWIWAPPIIEYEPPLQISFHITNCKIFLQFLNVNIKNWFSMRNPKV